MRGEGREAGPVALQGRQSGPVTGQGREAGPVALRVSGRLGTLGSCR